MSSKLFLLFENIALFSVIFLQLKPTIADSNKKTIKCIDEEREALLTFKRSLVDEHGVLSSWGREDDKRDCCKWRGVHCSNTTGHVKVLNLRTSDEENDQRKALKGEISPALLELHDIRYLDLSNNHFSASPVPEFIGSLSKLRYLNISCSIPLELPRTLRNFSGLEYLNLENSHLFSVGSLEWLSRLSSLRHLDLSYINLTKSRDWFQVVAKLRSLKTLVLRSCALPPINPSFIWHFNLSTSIETLDLADNNLPSSSVYPWLFNLSRNMLHLNLGSNSLRGSIPEAFQNMVSLKSLCLSASELEGGIPKFFGNMCSLKKLGLPYNKLSGQFSQVIQNLSCGCVVNSLEGLYLHDNDFTGPVPHLGGFSSLEALKLDINRLNGTINESLSRLFKLKTLSFDRNSFTGVISQTFFSNMSNLQELFLADNSLTLKLSDDWVPPFQLKRLSIASCKMGPNFPKWLQTQNQLVHLHIANVGISDTIPDWFWDLSSKLSYLNLSNNHIKGKLPDLSLRFDGTRIGGTCIDINSNHFEGPIPPLPSNSPFLNLSKNKFIGSVTFLCSISENTWNFLDLSSNLLSGELPDCWLHFDSLFALNLANNSFSGKIPDSMGFLNNIRTLNLHNNRLTGELPSSLRNCSQLRVLDLGKNTFFGEIPTWIGESLQNLIVLSLKSNKFHGNIPYQLCHLGFIQVLDLSFNNISGKIPKCFNNFSAMTYERCSNPTIGFGKYILVPPRTGYYYKYLVNLLLTWKGSENEYKSTLGLVRCLDLSSNKLDGAIPEEIMDLVGLIALNLSRNNLTGPITPKIGELTSLDFLDLSRNLFSGSIPSSLSQLSGLGVLDLSYNNLSGKIPLGTQLQSFNASVYAGNLELCGLPLANKCPDEESTPSPGTDDYSDALEDEDDQFITLGFYVSSILGFFVGFWGVCGTLMLNRPWRHGYFNFLTGMKDWVYVIVAVNIAKLQRKFRN
ncbi:receptor-like protein EIX1 [Citrus sinensis]|uniref:receptor-like protein EIX1 n=1 Tax=Citrus sinensis TaxID=2711 RepID=UPI0022799F98|nr:receptor-like protein EIX1 [Citrus sinensis]